MLILNGDSNANQSDQLWEAQEKEPFDGNCQLFFQIPILLDVLTALEIGYLKSRCTIYIIYGFNNTAEISEQIDGQIQADLTAFSKCIN